MCLVHFVDFGFDLGLLSGCLILYSELNIDEHIMDCPLDEALSHK